MRRRSFHPRIMMVLCAVAVFAFSAAPKSLAQDLGDAWTTDVINRLQRVQFAPQCFSKPEFQRHVHVLGVEAGSGLLSEVLRSKLLNLLSDALAGQTQNRITIASTFQFIAATRSALNQADALKVARLDTAARNAEITILLRPLELAGPSLTLEVVLWVNDTAGGSGEYTCARQFNVSVSVTGRADPRCQEAWSKAQSRDAAQDYRAFITYFESCEQVDEARRRLETLKTGKCDAAWAQTRAEGTLAAYQEFVRQHSDCSVKAQTANVIIGILRQQQSGSGGQPQPQADQPEPEPEPQPSVTRTTRTYHFVGPVNPPDPWLALRTRPSSKSGRRIAKMPEGTLFEVIGRRGRWLRVRLRDGRIGWAHSGWIHCCQEVVE